MKAIAILFFVSAVVAGIVTQVSQSELSFFVCMGLGGLFLITAAIGFK